ncbi:MAG: sulfotransferase [Elusimicrobiota bacterium]
MNQNLKIVAIVYHGRSGSFFLQSLLDNHPELFGIPGSYFGKYFSWFSNQNPNATYKELIQKFTDNFSYFFDANDPIPKSYGFDQMGENKDQKIEISKVEFIQNLENAIKSFDRPNRREFFFAIHSAYALCLGENLDNKKAIVYHIHHPHPDFCRMLISDFPQTKFIHTTREPIQGLLSLFKHMYSGYSVKNPRSYCVADIFWSMARGAYPMDLNYIESSRMLKLEGLHEKPKEVLLNLIKFLDIKWDDNLMESTFNGLKWWNLKAAIQVTGFNSQTTKAGRYSELTNFFDSYRYKILFYPFSRILKYPNIPFPLYILGLFFMPLLLIFPFKIEWIGLRYADKRGFSLVKNFLFTRFVLFRMFLLIHFGIKIILRKPFVDFLERGIFRHSSIKLLTYDSVQS